MISDHHRIKQVLTAALECSFYICPIRPGLTWPELLDVAAKFELQVGEVGDAFSRMDTETTDDTRRIIPSHTQVSAWLTGHHNNPDFRDWDASEFLHKEMKNAVRMHGVAQAKIERSTLVERGVAAGINRIGLEAAIAIDLQIGHFLQKEGVISYAHGHDMWPMPSEQRKTTPAVLLRAPQSEVRAKAYSLVRDLIERRTDGRPPSADPLDAFVDCLEALGYSRFKLWWRQTVDEMKRGDVQTTPVSVTVLSAALVEGALTFVVQHARSCGVPAFASSDFDGTPQRWKINDLVKSAARGGAVAIIDDKTRQRAEWLIAARQRIHAGQMLSEYPGSVPDYRPERAREAKLTAELVVRQILDWLDRFPSRVART